MTRPMKRFATGAVIAMTASVMALWAGGCGAEVEQAPVEQDHEALSLRAEELADELDLDDDQRERLHEALAMGHEEHETIRSEKQAHFEELRSAVAAGDLDRDHVHERVDAKLNKIRAVVHRVVDEVVPLVNSLDEEQRQALVEKMDRFHEKAREARAKRHGRFGPPF